MTENELCGYVEKYRPMVFRLAFSYLKNYQDADDISQEAFLKLYMTKEQFKSSENAKAWLIRVTINLSKNLLKSGWRKRREDITDDIPYETNYEYHLLSIIGQLKPDYRVVIHLFYYENYSIKEISDILQISSSAVRTRLTRARNHLKQMLLKEGFYETGISENL